MKMMKLSEMNNYMSNRCGMGTPHNMGIKTQERIDMAGHEIKENPPKILAHTKKKFGMSKMKKQKTAIMLAKARKEGADIPLKKS